QGWGEQTAKRRFTAGSPGRQGGGDSAALARSQAMSLQSSKKHKVNGMTTRAIYFPSPQPSP
ncbi:hypothetical protein ACPRSH_17275, partial [Enterobacter asburiae]